MSEEQIEAIIDYANNQVRWLVENTDHNNFEDDTETQRLYLALARLYEELNIAMSDIIPEAIFDRYSKGLALAEDLIPTAGMGGVGLGSKGVEALIPAPIHVEAITNIVSDTLEDLSAAIRTAETYGFKELDKAIDEVHTELANGMIAGFTHKQISKRVAEKFAQHGMTSFVTKDGKHLPLDFYAKTVTRTKLQTAENHAHLNRYKERKVKHVEVVGNIPTCGECAVYRGLVFATESGGEFPHIDLHKTFPLHPNCRCNFRPYITKFKSKEEIQERLEKSKQFNPDKDVRSKAEAKKYDVNQKAKAAARRQRLTFVKFNSQLGKDGPQSFKEYKNASKQQYHKWVAQTKNVYKRNENVIINKTVNKVETRNNMNLNEYAKHWVKDLIDDVEGLAINRYTDDSSERINAYLRGVSDEQNIKVTQQDIQDIELIKNAINKFKFNKPLTLYRGLGENEYKNILEHSNLQTFLEFKSTSTEKSVAENFAYNQEVSNKDGWNYLLKVNVPKFGNGAYIEQLTEYEDEFEYLLNVNQKYKVVGQPITPQNTKLTILEIEVLDNE